MTMPELEAQSAGVCSDSEPGIRKIPRCNSTLLGIVVCDKQRNASLMLLHEGPSGNPVEPALNQGVAPNTC